MTRSAIHDTLTWARWALLGAALAGAMVMGGCGVMGHNTGAERPAPSAFGNGPRASAAGLFMATIEPATPLRLCAHCRSVTVLSPGARLRPHLPEELGARLRATPRVAVRRCCEIVEVVGIGRMEALVVRDGRDGRTRVRAGQALFIVGLDRPRTSWLTALTLDARGFVVTGREPGSLPGPTGRPDEPNETTLRGVFAAGPVRREATQTVAGSIEDGISAPRQALSYLRATDAGR